MLRDILNNQHLVTCEPDAKVTDVAKLMADNDIGAVMVLTDEKPRGIVTDRDIVLRCVAQNTDVDDTTVEQVMTESVATCHENDGIFDCIMKMKQAKVRRIPVVDDSGKAVGIISFGDLLAVLSKEFVELTQTTTPLEEHKRKPSLKAA